MLFWIVHEIDGKPSVFIQEAYSPIAARLRTSIAGHAGKFKEFVELDDRTARRVPRNMIGRALSGKEVKALLKRMG